jgi:uroporphyrinogen-III synthase
LFTSAHAVAAVGAHISQPAWQIFCLSGKTQTALLEHFSEDNIIATAPNAMALVPKIMAAKPVGEYVFFCGNKHLNILPAAFLANHISLTKVVVYETLLSPKRINDPYDGILFFSPSAVESFFGINRTDARTVCFAIGETTANVLREFTNNPVITAGFPDMENMVGEVKNYFKTK